MTNFTFTDLEDAAAFLDNYGGGLTGDVIRAADAELERRRRELERQQGDLTTAMHKISLLLDDLSAIRDIAYRAGPNGAADALEAIHSRAVRAIREEG